MVAKMVVDPTVGRTSTKILTSDDVLTQDPANRVKTQPAGVTQEPASPARETWLKTEMSSAASVGYEPTRRAQGFET